MRVKIRNKITSKRVKVLIVLICAETFLIPLNALLSQGVWPTPIQVVNHAVTATIQGVTMAMGLIEKA